MTDFELWYMSFVNLPTVVDHIGFILLLFISLAAALYIVVDAIFRSRSPYFQFKYIAHSFLVLVFCLTALLTSAMINAKVSYTCKQIRINFQHINQMLDETSELQQKAEAMLQEIINDRNK